jgi:hypothetical protein
MKRTGIAAALIAAMLATPAMACTDWKAVAAFDAVIATRDAAMVARNEAGTRGMVFHNPPTEGELAIAKGTEVVRKLSDAHFADTVNDREAALADKCQEDAR